MADMIEVIIEEDRFAYMIGRMPEVVYRENRNKFRSLASKFRKRVISERIIRGGGQRGRNTGSKVVERSGALRRSLRTWVKGKDLDSLRAGVLAGTRGRHKGFHAHLHEYGANPKPAKSKYLAVPMPLAKTKRGKLKATAKEWNHTFVRRARSGRLFIWGPRNPKAKSARAKVVPLFALLKGTRVPPRLGIQDSFKSFEGEIKSGILDATDRALEKVAQGKKR